MRELSHDLIQIPFTQPCQDILCFPLAFPLHAAYAWHDTFKIGCASSEQLEHGGSGFRSTKGLKRSKDVNIVL
jgi:hypothetical protein